MFLPQIETKYTLFALILLLSNKITSIGTKFLGVLTTQQWLALTRLSYFESPPTLKELAEALNSSHQNAKQIVLKLEQKGYVTLSPDTTDRRALRITLTPKFSSFSEDFAERSEQFLARLYSSVSEAELAQALQTLCRIYDNLDSMEEF